ncbi:TetR/AcrR family transcriptional regulator [Skermania sp. ID1734]|uniref:TetR/AcrR family transcriptional regulator n=1 Tax=Skermania sp. ID1734 TaxID=2597516 RepID=UPI00117F4A8D|nr:TetR/AcrR family transcriptional regulator [Skermania sp. ID1734]TSD99796.1 TetR/AcrR family transcriptional regulator [Skermania sp. ID1734]
MRSVTRQRDETRRRLLDAAFTVFAAKGFGRTRIDDICRAANFTKGAFYSNFASLEDLFYALYREQSRFAAVHTVDVLATAAADPDQAIRRWAEQLPIDRDWLLINTDFVLHAARHPEVAAQLARERTQFRHEVTALIAAYVREHADRLPPTLAEPEKWARAIVTVYDGAIHQLLLDMDESTVREHFAAIAFALARTASP